MTATHSTPVRIEGLRKAFGGFQAVRGINLRAEPGTTLSLLGPSGCGKTTTLRCIAGLETPSSGRIVIGNVTVFDADRSVFVDPERRNIGMVFQSYAVWPHMTVGGNVAFPLRVKNVSRKELARRTDEVLEMVGMAGLRDRSAADLSGGQQQRVALARALIHEPAVVLFDEPLSNLDANLRQRMRTELQILQERLGFTAIYVTHDQQEALALSDRVVIMNEGSVEQHGTPREVFEEPKTPFAARFLGYANLFPGRVRQVERNADERVVDVELADGSRVCARWRSDTEPTSGMAAKIAFRADRVGIDKHSGPTTPGRIRCVVETAAFLGTFIDYSLVSGPLRFRVEGPVEHTIEPGREVELSVATTQCHAYVDSAESPTPA